MLSNVIAIDGPAASGKSTVAKSIALATGAVYISTGLLYRAIAWKALRSNVNPSDENALASMLKSTRIEYVENETGIAEICCDGVFPGKLLRTPEVASTASVVAVYPSVRNWTLEIQRKTAESKRIVMEGRDIGTVIFPDAKYKFFLTASPIARAKRRLAQEGEFLSGETVERVAAEIAERDKRDSERAIAPLRCAKDAILIDNSDLSQEQTLEQILKYINA